MSGAVSASQRYCRERSQMLSANLFLVLSLATPSPAVAYASPVGATAGHGYVLAQAGPPQAWRGAPPPAPGGAAWRGTPPPPPRAERVRAVRLDSRPLGARGLRSALARRALGASGRSLRLDPRWLGSKRQLCGPAKHGRGDPAAPAPRAGGRACPDAPAAARLRLDRRRPRMARRSICLGRRALGTRAPRRFLATGTLGSRRRPARLAPGRLGARRARRPRPRRS